MSELLDKYCEGEIEFNECYLELKSKLIECVVCIDPESDTDDWVECVDDIRVYLMDLYYLIGAYKLGIGVESFRLLSELARLSDEV